MLCEKYLKKIFMVVYEFWLRGGGYGEFWIVHNSQAYSTEFAHYYWFVITRNYWNFQGILWIISWDIQIFK